MEAPTQAEIEDKLRGEDLNTWINLWHAEQGPAKPGALKLIAAAIPFAIDRSLRILDVGCGPGDAGRAIHMRFPHARIDFVDRNEFFVSLCIALNHRDGIGGRTWVRDLSEPDWRRDLGSDYDVVVAVNAVHWFSLGRAVGLFGDIFQSLRSGGVFLLMEPAAAAPPFAPGFNAWQTEQPSQHKYEDWQRFWSRVDALIGYDYGFLGEPDEHDRIGDGLSVMQWVDLLTGSGFESVDILLRDAEKVVLASAKGASSRAAIQERNSAEPERRGAPVLREFLRSAKGASSRAAIQERNSAAPERRGAPVLREFLRSAKGALSRAAIQERNSAEPERRGARVLREFLRSPV